MSGKLNLSEVRLLGANRRGYRFCVGRLGDGEPARWIGFAVSRVGPNEHFMQVFPEVSEGVQLGMRDEQAAIRLTAALAQDPEGGYGGVDCWVIEAWQIGDPEEFRCERCRRVGCQGEECGGPEYGAGEREDAE